MATEEKPFSLKIAALCTLVVTVCLAGTYSIVNVSPKPEVLSEPKQVTQEQIDDTSLTTQTETIETQWQWENFEPQAAESSSIEQQENTATPTVEFDVKSIHDALADVKLDEYGNIIYDEYALKALHKALVDTSVSWTPALIEQFQEIVRTGLPGEAGEQATNVIGDFYKYIEAKQAMTELYGQPETMEDMQALYEEMVTLRRLYLTEDVATPLFAKEEAESRYMMESMFLSKDTSLSEEERSTRQQEIREQHENRAPSILDWDMRYQAFLSEKTDIVNAAIPEEEKQGQLNQLLHQHFSQSELVQVTHLNLDAI